MSSGAGRLLRAARRVDDRTLEWVFALVVLAIPVTFLAVASTYDATSRLFPTVVGVPAVVLQLLVLGTQFSPRLRSAVARVDAGAGGNFGDDVQFASEAEGDSSEVASPAEQRTNLLRMVGWLGFLVALIYVTGYTVGVLVFLLLIYQVHTGASRLRGLVYAVAMWLFVILVFVVVLNAPLYDGLLGVSLPL